MTVDIVQLSDVLDLLEDRVAVAPGRSFPQAGVRGFGGGLFAKEAVAFGETTYRHFNRLYGNALVVSQVKGWEGAIALCDDGLVGRFVSPEYRTFSCRRDRASPRYLLAVLLSPWFLRSLTSATRGQGARRERTRPEELLRTWVPLPSLSVQEQIAARFETIEGGVRHRSASHRTMLDDAERALQLRYLELVAGAPRRPLGEVAPLNRRPVRTSPGTRYQEVAVRSFGRGTFHKGEISADDLSWQKLFLVQAGDLVFSNIKAWEGAVAVARQVDDRMVASHRYLTCTPDLRLARPEFLKFHFLTPDGLSALGKASPGSADRNRTLAAERLRSIEVPVPRIELQNNFVDLLRKFERIQQLAADAADELSSVRDVFLSTTLRELSGATDASHLVAGRPSTDPLAA